MMKTKQGVSVIIPTFNGIDLLRENLPTVLEAGKNPVNRIFEIIVVDDGSADETDLFLKKNFPDIKVIKHRKNRGFSAAVNTGARSAKGTFLVLLNSDVSPSKNFLKPVLSLFKEDRGLFAASFHERGYGWAVGAFEEGFIVHKPGKEGRKPHNTFFVNGGGAVFRRDLWMRLGGMDERLFAPFYWEDVDISYRALKRGYNLLWAPYAYVSPNLSATVSKLPKGYVSRIQQRNQLLFIWKNLTSPILFRKHIFGLLKRLSGHPGYLLIVLMALKKFRVVMRARAKEKKESKISDEAIFARF